jgi:polyhydroxyalkanoate synthesis regulator phasin
VTSTDDGWQRALRGAEALARTLVRRGEVAADAAEALVEDLVARSERNRRWIIGLVTAETERTVARLGLARQRDLDRAEARIVALTARVEGLEALAARDDRPLGSGRA